MILSVSLILLLGLMLSYILKKCKLPGLIGMLLSGIILGPYVLNLIDSSILDISLEIRKIALVIVLTKAGLSLDLSKLKNLGLEAVLMSFVPACFEICAVAVVSTNLLGISVTEGFLLGATLAAVSPAVVVPRMTTLLDNGYGVDKGIPQLILSASSIDDVVVIVIFQAFLCLLTGSEVSAISFINIPISILLGIIIGIIIGFILSKIFDKFKFSFLTKAIILLSISLILVVIESSLTIPITFASLISVMFMGIKIKKDAPNEAKELTKTYGSMWKVAEIFLFTLVGASIRLDYLTKVGFISIVIILIGLSFRMIGVAISIIRSKLNKKERLFTMIAYTPKATVQAALGGVALACGLECGEIILIVSACSIILTAPLGAIAIDNTYKHLLNKNE